MSSKDNCTFDKDCVLFDKTCSHYFFQATLHASGEAITITDEQSKVLYFNDKAEALYGIKKDAIIGKDINEFFDNLVVTQVIQTGEPVMEQYHQAKPGTFVLINTVPVIKEGKIIGGVSIEREITEMVNLNMELIKANTELHKLKQEIGEIHDVQSGPFSSIYGHNKNLKRVIDVARRVAKTDASILITGESGTGKELFARAIHNASSRKDKPFIAVNCSAIPENLFESELFGYEEGAFTGAKKTGKPGKFELANGGTLFLDEISEMDLGMQAKLLRVLQDSVFYRVGGQKPVEVDVRIMSASNRDLEFLAGNNQFREDLFFRLNVVHLEIPPLRERKGDIPELVYMFINELNKIHGKKIQEVAPEVMTRLLKYHWPGNVRELRNAVERLVVLSEGDMITEEQLDFSFNNGAVENHGTNQLGNAAKDAERKLILNALEEAKGNKVKAAELLGIPRSTLYYKMNKLKIDE